MIPEISQFTFEQKITNNPFAQSETKKTNENIFQGVQDKKFSESQKQLLKTLQEYAKQKQADLIQESVVVKADGSIKFEMERETPKKDGMEILCYTADPEGNLDLNKKLVLEYTDSLNNVKHYCYDANGVVTQTNISAEGTKETQSFFSPEKISEIQKKKTEMQGTLNIINAIFDETEDEDIKLLFAGKQELLRNQLDQYDNFFVSNNFFSEQDSIF